MASEVDRYKDLETSNKRYFKGFIHSKASTIIMQDYNKHYHFLTCSVEQS